MSQPSAIGAIILAAALVGLAVLVLAALAVAVAVREIQFQVRVRRVLATPAFATPLNVPRKPTYLDRRRHQPRHAL